MAKPTHLGVQDGDYNRQDNYFAPVTQNLFRGSAERLDDVCFDPTPLAGDLDLARFTGRDWLIRQVDRFIQDRPRGYVIVQGEAGVGKSALAAHLVGSRPWLHHFTRLPGGRSPETARKSLAAQLIARWDLTDEWAPTGVLPASAGRPDWFDRLLRAAARSRDRHEAGIPIVLVIDGLDEAEEAEDSRMPLGLPESLPDGVFIVVTSRFGVDRTLHAIRNPADWLLIEVDGPENLSDMRHFIDNITSADCGDPRILAVLADAGTDVSQFRLRLADSCAGVWIYLRYVLEEIRDGTREPDSIEELPGDLGGYYAEQIQRWRHKAGHDTWELVRLPLLSVLAVARAPLTLAELMSFAGISSVTDAGEFVDEAARAFLNCGIGSSGDHVYALRHQSLRDLLTGTAKATRPDIASLMPKFARDARHAHEKIVSALTPGGIPGERVWDPPIPYVRHHLAAHAAGCGKLDVLVCDPGYLRIAEPSSVLTHREALKTAAGRRAVGAYELSLAGWQDAPPGIQATRLNANAARVQADALALASTRMLRGHWQIRWARWSGRSHQVLSHATFVESVAIGRVGGTDVVVTGSGNAARIWDARTAQLRLELPLPGSSLRWLRAVAVGSIEGTDVVVALDSYDVHIWDARTGELRTVVSGKGGMPAGFALGRAGSTSILIIICCNAPEAYARDRVGGDINFSVCVLDAKTGKPCNAYTVYACSSTAIAIARIDGIDVIVAVSDDGIACIWDAVTGQVSSSFRVVPGQNEKTDTNKVRITAVAAGCAAGMNVVVTTSNDSVKQIWDARTGELRTTIKEDGNTSSTAVGSIAGTAVIATSSDQRVQIWDAETGELRTTLIGHDRWIYVLQIGCIGDVDVIVTGSQDKTARIWTIESSAIFDQREGHDSWLSSVATGRAGETDLVVSGSRDRTVRVWDARTGALRNCLTGHSDWVNAVAIGHAGDVNILASGSRDRTVRVWDARTGALRNCLTGHNDWVNAVAIGRADDCDLIVTASDDMILVWEAATGHLLRVLDEHSAGTTSLAIGNAVHDGIIVAGSRDGTARVWDATSGVLRYTLTGHQNWIRAVATGQIDGNDLVITSSDDKTARVWDACTGQLRTILNGHRHWVHAVAIGRVENQDVIVTGSWDKTARVWDAMTGQCHSTFRWHEGPVTSVALGRAADEAIIATGSADRTLFVCAQQYGDSWTTRS